MIEDLEKQVAVDNTKMNLAQVSLYDDNLESLLVILRHIQNLCNKDTDGKLRERIGKIIHVRVKKKSLMSSVLENEKFFVAHSILHQIEDYIHDKDSIAIQKCVIRQMGSSKLSKKTIDSMKKLHGKKKSCFQKTKIFMTVFSILLPFKLAPISMDVVTDSLLLISLKSNCTISNDGGFIF